MTSSHVAEGAVPRELPTLPLSNRERECLHGVLAAVSPLDRAGIRRVLAFANDLAQGSAP